MFVVPHFEVLTLNDYDIFSIFFLITLVTYLLCSLVLYQSRVRMDIGHHVSSDRMLSCFFLFVCLFVFVCLFFDTDSAKPVRIN